MNDHCFLLLNLNASSCNHNQTTELSTILRSHRWPWNVELRVQDLPLSASNVAPTLIFFGAQSLPQHKELVCILRETWETTPLISVWCPSNHLVEDLNSSTIWDDVDEYLVCPFREVDLVPRIKRVLRCTTGSFNTHDPICRQETSIHYGTLVGQSPCFLKAVRQIPSLAATEATVLVQGETGTGKELFARAIHEQSNRKDRAFVPVNCGALPDQLVENELFGHVKGAYTSAYTPQRGLVAEADGGTLFLDEVDTLPPPAQVKLLRFLQDRQYRPLGSSKSYYGNVRVIAATNTNLRKQVVDQRFRQDLFYRLNILSLTIPPLRERVEDIPLLASHLLAGHQSRGTAGQFRFSTESIRKLLDYHWPGNVREMEGIVQKASFLATSSILGPETIDLSVEPSHTLNHGSSTMREAKSDAVRDFERAYLAKLLSTSQGNVTHAARLAGKDRRAFQRLLQKYHLSRSQFSSGSSPSQTPY